MSSSEPARKRLPVRPSEENLKKQAKRLARNESIQLADAQHRLAREYGAKTWAELMHVVETMLRGADQDINVKYEMEALPKAANQSDIEKVRAVLASGEFTQHDLDLALARSVLRFKDRGEIARLLIEHGADPDGQYGSNYGPIVFVTGECLDPDGLQFLIDHGADVTFPPIETKYGGQCPLSYWLGTYARGENSAKHRGIEILLDHGAFVPPNITPAALAIHRGDAKMLGEMLDADPSLLTKRFADMPYGNIELRGATLLHCAVEFGEIECLDALFSRYADINLRADVIDGVGGQTPIFHALHSTNSGSFPVLEYLVKRVGPWIDMTIKATWRGSAGWAITGFDSKTTPRTPLEYAELAERDIDPAKVKYFPRAKDEVALLRSLDRRSLIRQACERGDVAAVTAMLDESPQLLMPELWPPTYKAKSVELTTLLLDRGLDPNVSSAPRRAIDLAAYHALPEIVELLITRGAEVTSRNLLGETPLDLLDAYEPRPIGDANSRRVRAALLAAGAVDDIHSAVRSGDVDLVRTLLDADPSLVRAPVPWNPLLTAARSGRLEVARLLIERGAAVDGANDKGNTPLWFACQSPATSTDRIAVAALLLEHGANPRRGCEDQTTPLHFAASRGPIAMVELLLRNNAKEWQSDGFGRKAIDHAREFGRSADREAIIELLDRPVIRDPNFKQAVAAIHAGDLAALRRLLVEHPDLVRDRAIEPDCYPLSYFSHPKLLWFVANNPNLIPTMPANSVEIATAIIDAGAEPADLHYTLGLVMTSGPAREDHLQRPLMKLLLDRGAIVNPTDLAGTLGHGERDAIVALLESGMPLTAPVAAGMGMAKELPPLLASADSETIHAAFSLAVINRETAAARLCLDAGADVNRRLIVHQHSNAVHQAAVNDDVPMLQLLSERDARLDVRDDLWQGTPLGWAIHVKRPSAAAYLRSIGAP